MCRRLSPRSVVTVDLLSNFGLRNQEEEALVLYNKARHCDLDLNIFSEDRVRWFVGDFQSRVRANWLAFEDNLGS